MGGGHIRHNRHDVAPGQHIAKCSEVYQKGDEEVLCKVNGGYVTHSHVRYSVYNKPKPVRINAWEAQAIQSRAFSNALFLRHWQSPDPSASDVLLVNGHWNPDSSYNMSNYDINNQTLKGPECQHLDWTQVLPHVDHRHQLHKSQQAQEVKDVPRFMDFNTLQDDGDRCNRNQSCCDFNFNVKHLCLLAFILVNQRMLELHFVLYLIQVSKFEVKINCVNQDRHHFHQNEEPVILKSDSELERNEEDVVKPNRQNQSFESFLRRALFVPLQVQWVWFISLVTQGLFSLWFQIKGLKSVVTKCQIRIWFDVSKFHGS